MNIKLLSILKREGLEHLSSGLTDQGVTDSILTELSDNDLREMGVDKLGERKRLLTAFSASGVAQNEPGAMVEVRGGVVPNFAIGKFALTMQEWRVVREWGGGKGFDIRAGRSGGMMHPVTEVSWYDVVKWCNAKSEMEGLKVAYTVIGRPYRRGEGAAVVCDWKSGGYRLPTEAEWEWAALGGVKSCGSKFAGGDDLGTVGCYRENSGGTTHQVGQKAPNELDLFDMSGNVFEWCWDSPPPNHRIFGSDCCAVRGGSFKSSAFGYPAPDRLVEGMLDNCLTVGRSYRHPGHYSNEVGFRLALVPSR